ncbi:MAG: RNA-binding transcriptional accessory protein [Desulfobulbaceae bacterium]|nr:RNA-binding transcriptional accessory protein [Desulfobulbaceae bacterium]
MYTEPIARTLNISKDQVQGTLELLSSGSTIPFIARYRKEATGSLDEVAIGAIMEQHQKLKDFDARRQTITETLEKNQILTDLLAGQLQKATSLTELEDIYLPYRQKRKTRGLQAREKGLGDLAKALYSGVTPIDFSKFINTELGVTSKEEALSGARDIIAEEISENQKSREELRYLYKTKATIESKVVVKKKEEGEKFRDYFEWQEPAVKSPGHRLLAMFRGEREKILKLTIRPSKESSLALLKKIHLRPNPWQDDIITAIEDSYQRLLGPSLENQLATSLKERADEEAIAVFAENLRQLLLAPPLGQKRLLAIDPGYRTGAKVVCISEQGSLLHSTTIYPTIGGKKLEEAATVIRRLVSQHRIEAIGIGNGTAGRETEEFIRGLNLDSSIIITLVNEDGASIYSASAIAREEFPDYDITVRGSVSIGRRLQDPLAELVKIDPKSIGVGQYQHDVNQVKLRQSLETVVESCVNSVGVELNSASSALLTHVAGLGKTLADNIVDYREANGPFTNRKELLKVPRLGPKAFEQCGGFLRIAHGSNPLDASGVHPERYKLIAGMAKDCTVPIDDFLTSESVRKRITLNSYINENVGLPTLQDIMAELAKPGRDPREQYEHFQFDDTIHSMEDLHEGITLPAIITNITRFGAFADIGIKQDGLIHISQLADRFVKDPGEIVKLGQKVAVRVLEIDRKRGRIALSMRKS